jgi:hypothetical protein
MFEAEFPPVLQEPQEIARVVPARNDHDIRDSGLYQARDRIVDHRPIKDWQQMLVGDPGHRHQTASETSGQYDPLHASSSFVIPAKAGIHANSD